MLSLTSQVLRYRGVAVWWLWTEQLQYLHITPLTLLLFVLTCKAEDKQRELQSGQHELLVCMVTGRSGSSEVPRNPLTRWDVSSTPPNGIFLTKKLNKSKNAQRVEND